MLCLNLSINLLRYARSDHDHRESDLQTRKHKPDFQHKKAVTASATLALHKVVLRVFSL